MNALPLPERRKSWRDDVAAQDHVRFSVKPCLQGAEYDWDCGAQLWQKWVLGHTWELRRGRRDSFLSMDFLKFGQSGGGSYIQQLCPGAQTRSSTRFLSAHLHGGTITAILPFCERRDGLSRKKDLSVAVFMMSVMNCTLQTRAVINWVCLTMMTNNIWREATKKQS